MKQKNVRPFGVRDQFGFWFGDMAGSFVNLYFDGFFLMFCTYILNVSPGFMAAMFFGARLFDAVNDPVIGSFPDRWRIGKNGDKFKPYIKIAMWPLAISSILGFMDISSFSETAKHIWVVVTYLLYGMSYTGASMPFGSMASVVTDQSQERTKLSRARAFGGLAVSAVYLSMVPLLIWDENNQPVASGYFIFGVMSAILCILCYNLLFRLTPERIHVEPKPGEKFHYGAVIKGALKNRALIGIMFASIGSLIFTTGSSQFGGFMYKEYYNAPKALQLASLGTIPIAFLLFPIVPRLTAKIGKRKYLLGALFFNLVISAFLFVVPIQNVNLFILLYLISNVGQNSFTLLVWAFVTDAIDYNEYLTGQRSDGSLYSIYTFSRKIGSTIASVGVSGVLAAVGFVSTAASQTPQVVSSIRMLGTGVPLLAVVMEIIGMGLIWNLTKDDMDRIQQKLTQKREVQLHEEN